VHLAPITRYYDIYSVTTRLCEVLQFNVDTTVQITMTMVMTLWRHYDVRSHDSASSHVKSRICDKTGKRRRGNGAWTKDPLGHNDVTVFFLRAFAGHQNVWPNYRPRYRVGLLWVWSLRECRCTLLLVDLSASDVYFDQVCHRASPFVCDNFIHCLHFTSSLWY